MKTSFEKLETFAGKQCERQDKLRIHRMVRREGISRDASGLGLMVHVVTGPASAGKPDRGMVWS